MSDLNSLREQLERLVQLQEIDLRIDQLEQKQNHVPKEIQILNQKLALLQREYSTKEAVIQEAEKAAQQVQTAIEMNDDRLKQTNEKIEQIQNSKEFSAMNREVEQLKKMAENLSSQKEKATKDIDDSKSGFDDLKAQFESLQKDRDEKIAKIREENKNVGTDLADLKKDQSERIQGIDPRIHQTYDRVRKAREGLGIVPLVGSQCQGCFMMVPPQMVNEMPSRTEITQCPSCIRILYVPTQSEPVDSK